MPAGNALNEQLDTVELSEQAKDFVAQEKALSQAARTDTFNNV